MPFTLPRQSDFWIAGLLSVFVWSGLSAQSFGGLPPSIKWHQINTDTCRIIFPGHLTQQAQRVANAIHYMRRIGMEEVGDQAFKIDLVLNNQSTIANGSVSIAPWKSHFLTTPPQNSFSLTALPWLDLLAVHEYRHVIQASTERRGITKLLYWLFGQESWAGASALAVPDWFAEGDAVWAETNLTTQGRGRTASFLKGYRAYVYENKLFNYRRARNRSIKHFIPDHYRLGYLLLSFGHRHFGADFWKGTLADAASYKGIFYPFSRAMKSRSGLNTTQFYDRAMEEYSNEWRPNRSEDRIEFIWPPKPLKVFTNITYPIVLDHQTIVYYQASFDRIGQFYKLNTRRESAEPLTVKGRSIESYHTYQNGKLCWTEISPHPRWIERNYNDIIIYDIHNRTKRKVTRKGKFFSPHLNRDHTQIVAVHQDESVENTLQIIDVGSGQVMRTLSNPSQLVYTYPKWVDEQHIVTSVRNLQGEMGILKVNTLSGLVDTIQSFSNVMIGAASIHGQNIVYTSSTSESENIFLQNLVHKGRVQITFESNGAFNPYLHEDQLFYTVFTTLGHHLKRVSISQYLDRLTASSAAPQSLVYDQNFVADVPKKVYPTKPYRRGNHLLNLHTWGFDFEDPIVTFRALSTNILNTMEASVGADYNYDLERFAPFARISYAGFFPQITLQGNTYSREATLADTLRTWRETNLSAFLSADLNLSSGPYLRNLVPLLGISHTIASGDLDFSLSSAIGRLTFINRRIRARKNLFTRNGQYLQLRFSESLDNLQARQWQLRSALSLPAFGINHNLILHADYKHDLEDADFRYTTGLTQRGYGLVSGDQMWRLSANYHLPLFYPDWGFGGLFYIYRVRSTLFFEHTSATFENVRTDRSSAGVEFVFDVNLVNTLEASFGIRYAYPIRNVPSIGKLEFFIPVYRF